LKFVTTFQQIDTGSAAAGAAGAFIGVGPYPYALACDGTRLWVTNAGDNTVQAIDTITGEVGAPIEVGGGLPTVASYMWWSFRLGL